VKTGWCNAAGSAALAHCRAAQMAWTVSSDPARQALGVSRCAEQANGSVAVRTVRPIHIEGLPPFDPAQADHAPAEGPFRGGALIALHCSRSPPAPQIQDRHRSDCGVWRHWPPSPTTVPPQLASCAVRPPAAHSPIGCHSSLETHAWPNRLSPPPMAPRSCSGRSCGDFLGGPETTAAPRAVELSGKGRTAARATSEPTLVCRSGPAGGASDPAGRRQRPEPVRSHRRACHMPRARATSGAPTGPTRPTNAGPATPRHRPVRAAATPRPPGPAVLIIQSAQLRVAMEMAAQTNQVRQRAAPRACSRAKAHSRISAAAGGPPRSLASKEESGEGSRSVAAGTIIGSPLEIFNGRSRFRRPAAK